MTAPPPPPDLVRRRRLRAMAWALVPILVVVAPVTLVIGLFASLVWVDISIAASGAALLSAVVGAVLSRRPEPNSDMWRFNPPPGWPPPTAGWVPAAGWMADPSWPAPPRDWLWWTRAD